MKKIYILIFSLILLNGLFAPIGKGSAETVTHKWGKVTYKENHIGKIIVNKNTYLYTLNKKTDKLTVIKKLKKGEEYPVYSKRISGKNGELLSIGSSRLVKNNNNISFKLPSKSMKETVGKQRVWLRNPYFIFDNKNDVVFLSNLQEAIILSKKTDDVIEDWYNIKIKVGSKYYTMENVNKDSQDEDYMYTNPFKKYKYSNEIWRLIKDQKIRFGMTSTQVTLSWGKPNDINSYGDKWTTSEQWIYGSSYGTRYLYFTNNKLESWQDF